MIDSVAVLRFRRLGMLTILAVYVIILVGGVVRASGAGMGCPDWPTCFGRWIPPTQESQLPANYHEIYAERGYKNTRFNPIKTWIEYGNRLVGVTVGFLIFLTAWSARIFLRQDKSIFYLCVLTFFLVAFQGWLGSAVVASHLKPFMVTWHMLLALLIVTLLIYVVARSQKNTLAQIDCKSIAPVTQYLIKIAMALTLAQIIMGAQVRESVDSISHQYGYMDRVLWPMVFYVHRSFAAIILLANLYLFWQTYSVCHKSNPILHCHKLLISLIGLEILVGISLDRLGLPAVAQPIHLLLANLIFGVQFFIYSCLKYALQ